MTWEEILKQTGSVTDGTAVGRKATFEEEHLQKRCCQWMAMQYPQWYQLLHHSPNGMRSNAKTGAIFKSMGTKAGFPDLFFFHPSGQYHGLAIEMKTHKKSSRQSPEQKRWEQILTEQGYLYVVCRDLVEFQSTIKQYINADS